MSATAILPMELRTVLTDAYIIYDCHCTVLKPCFVALHLRERQIDTINYVYF